MRSVIRWFLFILLVDSATASGLRRMEPNSFLIYPVRNVRELVQQIRTEPVVAARYAMHFGHSAFWLADYFEKNLRLITLPKEGVYTVYHVRKSDAILVRNLRLKKGTSLFVLRDGTPVLKVSCGNPIRKSLTTQATALQPLPASPESAMEPSLVESIALQPALLEAPPEEIQRGQAPEVAQEKGEEPPVLSEFEIAPLMVASSEIVPPTMSAPQALLPLVVASQFTPPGALLSVAAVLTLPNSHGPHPIPEPSALANLLLILGLFYLTKIGSMGSIGNGRVLKG